MPEAWLALEDGTVFQGASIGAAGEVAGEVVFNTAMTGYQEILTDPSYKGQIVTMTYPHIGNYGVNAQDVESSRPWVEGFVVRELSPIMSNFRGEQSLGDYLKAHGTVGIQGVDTRRLTEQLRVTGAMRGVISTVTSAPAALLAHARHSPPMTGRNLVDDVTCDAPYDWTEPPYHVQPPVASAEPFDPAQGWRRTAYRVVVMDFGVKRNILRQLVSLNCQVRVVPSTTSADEIMRAQPDGVVLSNGPGDPAAVTYAIATIQQLIGRVPLFGICLGHQLLGTALGGTTYKLTFGHHGANHPVKDLRTGQVAITAHNHGFALDVDSIPDKKVQLTHINLNDQTVEGIAHPGRRLLSVQYHPEASPGPHDARAVFHQFGQLMAGHGR